MLQSPRYAIYYVPPADSGLNRFGAGLLGYDPFSGHDLAFPDGILAAAPDWPDLTVDPRKYGFHGTLKAPFALAHDRTETELLAACENFAGQARALPVIAPVVSTIAGFIAVVPEQPSDELQQLARDCVERLDRFRAPMTPADRARRNPAALTARQRDHLDRWGYPYVMDDFRFHMTLTGQLPPARRDPVLEMLRDRFAALDLATLAIDRIALVRQHHAAARFEVVSQHVLQPATPVVA